MGRKAFEKRLQEIKMSEYDAERYQSFVRSVSKQITSLKQVGGGNIGIFGDKLKKAQIQIRKNLHPQKSPYFYKSHQVPVKFLLKIVIVINVNEKMKVLT